MESCVQGQYNISWMGAFTNLVCYNRSVQSHTLVEGIHCMECLCRCREQFLGPHSTLVCSTSWMSSAHLEGYEQLSLQNRPSIMIMFVVFHMRKTCHDLWDHTLFLLQLCYLTCLAQEMCIIHGCAASQRIGCRLWGAMAGKMHCVMWCLTPCVKKKKSV